MKFSCGFWLILATVIIDRSLGDDCKISSAPPEEFYPDAAPDSSQPTRFTLNLEHHIACENVILSENFHKKIHQFLDIPTILGLQISNSNSSVISPGAFASLDMIPDLRINGANVHIIQYGAFDGLSQVSYLSLRNNKIFRLEAQLFENLTMLQEMDLSHNSMSYIDKNAFYNLTKLEKLKLSQNLLLDLPRTVFAGLKKLKNLDLSANAIIYFHENLFKNLSNLENLVLDDNHLEILGKNLFASNAKLAELYINNNFLKELSDIVFPPSLDVVHITHNLIERLKFANSTKIKKLDLSDNKLLLTRHSFDNLEVEWLYLSHNFLGRSSNLDDVFRNISTLERIWLNNNEISSLGPNTFKHNQDLAVIRLSHNKLKNLVEFPKGLVDLLVSNNFLSSFDNLRNIDDLSFLDFSSNEITSISYNSLEGLDDLRTFVLENNRISTISVGSFRNMKRLLNLDLSYNNLKFIELGSFSGAKRMIEVDLSHNALEIVTDGLLYNLKIVETINLSYNNITFINFTSAASYLKLLKKVILDGNPLSCSNLLEIIKELGTGKLVQGGNDKVSNVHGIACRNGVAGNKSGDDYVIIVDYWIEEIILKQRTRNIILILFVVLLAGQILAKHFWSRCKNLCDFLQLFFARGTAQQENNSGDTSTEELEMI